MFQLLGQRDKNLFSLKVGRQAWGAPVCLALGSLPHMAQIEEQAIKGVRGKSFGIHVEFQPEMALSKKILVVLGYIFFYLYLEHGRGGACST